MSIARCTYCDTEYDQDTHVEHELYCQESPFNQVSLIIDSIILLLQDWIEDDHDCKLSPEDGCRGCEIVWELKNIQQSLHSIKNLMQDIN